MKAGFTLTLTFLSFAYSFAQKETNTTAFATYYRQAMEAYNFEHRKQAVDLFKKALAENPNHAMANLMAGKSILQTIHKSASLPYFKKAYLADTFVDEDILFLIGQGYHYNEQFDSALWYYDKFSSILMRSLQYSRMKKLEEVTWKTFECRNAMVYKANAMNIAITNLEESINSPFADYAPTITADGSTMIFTSRRPERNANETLAEDQEYFEEILISKFVEGKWINATQVKELNSEYHNASVSLSPDGKRMFVYSDENGGDIAETLVQEDGTWSEPKRLNGFVNSPYMEISVSVNAENTKLFFVSDRPDGYGGTDIYMSQKNKRGEWGEAVNLGNTINTIRDEEDVFISANGEHLYFSSNGHAGMGDLDVYRSSLDLVTQQWGEPMNLGYPINSVENDFYFVLSGDEKTAYLSSFRIDSKGEQDIYEVDMTNWKPIAQKDLIMKEQEAIHQTILASVATPAVEPFRAEPQAITYTVYTKDETTKELTDASLEVRSSDGGVLPVERKSKGEFLLRFSHAGDTKYYVTASGVDYSTQTSVLRLVGNIPETLTENISLKKLTRTGLSESRPMERTAAAIYFTFYCATNKVEPIDVTALDIIVASLRENPDYAARILAHTDNTGSEVINTELSKQRAEYIKQELVKAGVPTSRIQTHYFGETQPRLGNDKNSGRKLNRRIEVELIKQ